MATKIDDLIERHEEIRAFLADKNEVSLLDYTDSEFRKVFVLSIASYFEHRIVRAVSDLAASTNSKRVENLIRAKAISRQYHTYFDWNSNNANKFLGLFGREFRNEVSTEINEDTALKEGCESFLWLGRTRNRLVHENLVNASVENTLQEIRESYARAASFVTYLSDRIQPQNGS